ncbi:MAG: hypothetical protein ISR98_02265, partial [Parcubacteria group bacterium]|nr:hypothetical protein [Parcubacteria group bacterium]
MIYKLFKQKAGSERIATPLSINKIVELSKESKKTLELGGGIGTLSYAVLNSSDGELEIYEDNVFCIQQLLENLKEYSGKFTLHRYTEKPHYIDYDLVIVDGGDLDFTNELFELINVRVVYIEGIRRLQRKIIREQLSKRFAISVEHVNTDGVFKGGTVYRCYDL